MLTLLGIQGTQGVHTYWTTQIRAGELERAIVLPEQLPDLDPDHMMQRSLNKGRIGDLVDYLGEDDAFFSALTLIVLPRTFASEQRSAVEADAESLHESGWHYVFQELEAPAVPGLPKSGLLHISGEAQLFPADGQHRARAIVDAVKEHPELASRTIPVVVIPFHSTTRVRQVFSDLNRNAKVVSKAIGYDFESRDPAVTAAKAAIWQVPLFVDRVNRISNSLPKTSANVITMTTVVDGSEDFLGALAERSVEEKMPSAERLETYLQDEDAAAKEIAHVWNVITSAFGGFDDVLHDRITAGEFRDLYIIGHGLGFRACALAAGRLIKQYDDWERRLTEAIRRLDWSRTSEGWLGIATVASGDEGDPNRTIRVNNTGPAIRAVAERIVTAAQS